MFGSRRSEDRLATAVFLAALLHGLVILGVRFSAPSSDEISLPTLEVLLVSDAPEVETNREADYIAQRNQRGSGTSQDKGRTSLPEASASLLESQGVGAGDPFASEPPSDAAGEAQVLASRARDLTRAREGSETERSEAAVAPMEARPMPRIGVNAMAADEVLRLRGDPIAEDLLIADTRASSIATYLDNWKRRIERVGTINFPDEARRSSLSGNPVLEVVINADGSLEDVIVRRSSGHRELDVAAVRIVRLSSPFDPFPAAMRESYPVFRFAYEWRFFEGRSAGSRAWADKP
jgi:protein TonB